MLRRSCCLHLTGWYPTTTLHGVTTHKTSTWNFTAVKTSNLAVLAVDVPKYIKVTSINGHVKSTLGTEFVLGAHRTTYNIWSRLKSTRNLVTCDPYVLFMNITGDRTGETLLFTESTYLGYRGNVEIARDLIVSYNKNMAEYDQVTGQTIGDRFPAGAGICLFATGFRSVLRPT